MLGFSAIDLAEPSESYINSKTVFNLWNFAIIVDTVIQYSISFPLKDRQFE